MLVIAGYAGGGNMTINSIRRREFIAGLGAAALPFAARAQGKVSTIGLLITGNPSLEAYLKGFREGLQQVGLIEGQHVRLEPRYAPGTGIRAMAEELVRLKVDVIVASLTPAVQAAKEATREIPVVMAPAGDPVGTGLIASLARPGGNLTGVTTAGAEVAGKTLELVRELFPSSRRVAVLANEIDPFTKPYVAQLQDSGRRIGLEVEPFVTRPSAAHEPIMQSMQARQMDAVIVQGSLLRKEIIDLALKYRLPSLGTNRSLPTGGGFLSYAADFADVYRLAADYVDKILKGRKPADLPVAFPTKFQIVINLKTAKALGLTIPESFLLRADEVIE
jgi:putative tryptophan/tyrosine transport system substrate-binding protein